MKDREKEKEKQAGVVVSVNGNKHGHAESLKSYASLGTSNIKYVDSVVFFTGSKKVRLFTLHKTFVFAFFCNNSLSCLTANFATIAKF